MAGDLSNRLGDADGEDGVGSIGSCVELRAFDDIACEVEVADDFFVLGKRLSINVYIETSLS